jgi:hypothetical protein
MDSKFKYFAVYLFMLKMCLTTFMLWCLSNEILFLFVYFWGDFKILILRTSSLTKPLSVDTKLNSLQFGDKVHNFYVLIFFT